VIDQPIASQRLDDPLIGLDTREFIPRFIQGLLEANSDIELVVLPVPHRVQTRLKDSARAAPLLDIAREARHQHGLSFWESLITATVKLGPQFPEELIDAALYHQDVAKSGRRFQLPASQLTTERIEAISALAGPRDILMIRSQVGDRFIPMVDLSLPSEIEDGADVVRRLFSQLGVPGYLLRSGRSYHFYGERLLDQSENYRFLGTALLLAPLVDQRWIAHQLIEGQGALRISAGYEKQHFPYVLGRVTEAVPRSGS
jgi:hypothetical protein